MVSNYICPISTFSNRIAVIRTPTQQEHQSSALKWVLLTVSILFAKVIIMPYRKSSIKPPPPGRVAYLISGPKRGGLIREGGLIQRGGLFQITYF